MESVKVGAGAFWHLGGGMEDIIVIAGAHSRCQRSHNAEDREVRKDHAENKRDPG